jgi:predicted ATPase/DNA-binding XRE family transcriptional regulator
MPESRASFSTLLRQFRSAAALSQEELAERSGLSRRGISDLERGASRAPRLETVRLLAAGLGLTSEERAALLAAARPAVWEEAPTASKPSPLISLPRPLTRLIGRETELMTLRAGLKDDDVRLLSLTGPGGVGKTRLAIAVAATMADTFLDGVVFVDFSPLTDPDLVVPTVAAALGVRESAGRRLGETLATFLAPKRLLLVLDNCERVLTAAPAITTLLAASPGLTVFATSRAAFHVRGEREISLLPLPLPAVDRVLAVQAVAQIPAITLFVERARAGQPDFALSTDNASAIADICQRLDGLPLAIELAAARVKVLPPAALLARLEPRLPLLAGGGRDLPMRQRTLRDTIAWSYDLLSPEHQVLFRRLAVFAGGCTLDAAEAVAQGGREQGALDGIAALVEQSLLRHATASDDEPRYLMLETVREFGLERLAASGEADDARRRHAAWCLMLAEQADPALMGPEQSWWLRRLATEHDNLRAALAWSAEQPDDGLLRLAVALIRFWRFRSLPSEGQLWLERALARGMDASAALRARALLGAGIMVSMRGDYGRAADFHMDALCLSRDLGDRWGTANALFHLGDAVGGQGDTAQASTLFAESLALFRALGDAEQAILPLKDLGRLARQAGDYQRAKTLLEEALALCQETGFRWGAAETLLNLGQVASAEGNLECAANLLVQSLGLYVEQGDRLGIASCVRALAGVSAATGKAEQAAQLLGAAAGLHEAIGLPPQPTEAMDRGPELAATRAAIGEQAFVAAWNAGRALPLAQVLAVAQAATGCRSSS